MHGVVYVITNAVNGKRYVGQTTANPAKYWKFHLSAARKGKKLLYGAIRKYGRSCFEFEVIWHADCQASLDVSEDSFIILFDTLAPNGYNVRCGGSHGKHTDATRQLITEQNAERLARPGYKENIRALTKIAMARPDVRERCGDAMRNRSWITNGTESRVIAAKECIPDGWELGRTTEASKGTTFATNGISIIRVKKGTALPPGWRFGGNGGGGKSWVTDGTRNLRISDDQRIPNGWELGFTIRSKTHAIRSGIASAGSRWITNGINNKRTFEKELPIGWYYGKVRKQ